MKGAFPRSALYRDIRSSPCSVRENKQTHHKTLPFTERHLQCVWFDPSLHPPALLTSDGKKITVLNPGIWNLEKGPDFLKAVALINGKTIRGDVEIHIYPDDWRKHGHSNDANYGNVVLHVCYSNNPGLNKTTCSSKNNPVPVEIFLKDQLDAMPGFNFNSIDISSYPFNSIKTISTPCRTALRGNRTISATDLLISAGQERLRRKLLRMKELINRKGPDQALYEEILCALGYKNNKGVFRHLANILPLSQLIDISKRDPVSSYALLMGTAGLLPENISPLWDRKTKRFIRTLWDHWWKAPTELKEISLSSTLWNLSGIRPQNHPRRRLAGVAAFFTSHDNFSSILLKLAEKETKVCVKTVLSTLEKSSSMHYWNHRLSFKSEKKHAEISIIGKERASAIFTNVVIPFLGAMGVKITRFLDYLPKSDNNRLCRHMSNLILGPDYSHITQGNPVLQQGLLAVYEDFCVTAENDCRRCSLPERLTRSF